MVIIKILGAIGLFASGAAAMHVTMCILLKKELDDMHTERCLMGSDFTRTLYNEKRAVAAYQGLCDIIKKRGYASVSDFNKLVGDTSGWKADKYGWRVLSDHRILKMGGSCVLCIPNPIPLD